MRRILDRPAAAALLILLISWLTVRAGIALGTAMVQPGEGFQQKTGIQQDLFRFDAEYYFTIATEGYSYDGNPHNSPNIVFAPLYPVLIWTLASLPGVSEVLAGFLLNKIFLFLALYFLFRFFAEWFGSKRAFWILLAMATAAGAYSLHAYYSESTMLLALSLILWGYQKKNWPVMAVAAAAAGASRLAALPVAMVTAAYLLAQLPRAKNKFLQVILAAVCLSGSAAFLVYLGYTFGNPFRLLPEIQGASWGFFHPETPLWQVFTGYNLVVFLWQALARGWHSFIDIKTLNLVWTLLALASVIYGFRKFGARFFMLLFASYFVFAYGTGAGSDFLISAHRFYLLMLPIYVMFTALTRHRAINGLLILINVIYCLLHTALFNQGIWFYF